MNFTPTFEVYPIVTPITAGTTVTVFDMDGVEQQLWSVPVVAEARQLRAQWTPEMVQDLQVFHNIDAQGELEAILAAEMQQAMNREIVQQVQRTAHRGEEFMSAGFVFAPYIPVMVLPAVVGEVQPRQGIVSRYANRTVNPDYYGRLNINVATRDYPDGVDFTVVPYEQKDDLIFTPFTSRLELDAEKAEKSEAREKIIDKWSKLGLLDGLTGLAR